MRLSVAGAAFLLGTFATGIAGWSICVATTLLLILGTVFPQYRSSLFRVHHGINDAIAGLWFDAVGFLIEVVHGVRISVAVDKRTDIDGVTISSAREDFRKVFRPPPKGKFTLVMMNHRTRLDWMLFWAVLARVPFRQSAHLKIVLAERLAAVPIFGWAMQHFRFLFLSRKWEKDEPHLQAFVRHYKALGEGCTLLIFPEGTDLSETNLEKSQSYARANNLPQYRYILNPRTTGIDALRQAIGEENIHSIVDVTLGYTDGPGGRPGDRNLLQGDMPKKLHLSLREYRFGTPHPQSDWFGVPSTVPFSEWVKQRFQAKEVALECFYRQNPVQFPGEGPSPTPTARYVVMWICWAVICYWVLRYTFSGVGFTLLALLGCANAIVTSKVGGIDRMFFFRAPSA